MRYLIVDEHTSREDLAEAITNLRGRQRRATVPTVQDELAADIDELLDLYTAKAPAPEPA